MRYHDRAAILSTGDEIAIGQLLDTNSRYLAEQLTGRGVLPVEHVSIPDVQAQLAETIRRLADRVPLVIMSGGLGPTDGDLTRPALAEVLGEELIVDDASMEAIRSMLAKRGREMSERQARQAMRPRGATSLPNGFGTAPGLHAVIRGGAGAAHGECDVFCLPGPPGEMRPMFEREVLPRLRVDPSRVIQTRLLHIVGIPEAEAVTRLGDLTQRGRNPLVGITASGGVLTMRIRFEGVGSAEQATAAMDEVEARVRGVLGKHVFARDAQTLASVVVDLLKARGRTLGVVESCTGGMLGQLVTEVPGSSAAFVGGFITYSNEAKTREVDVDAALLREHGAVSEPVASAMAAGGLARLGVNHAIAITGIAGPDGGTSEKPVGTVWIAHAWKEDGVRLDVRRFVFTGGREDVRNRAARTGLVMLYFALAGDKQADGAAPRAPVLLWEAGAKPV